MLSRRNSTILTVFIFTLCVLDVVRLKQTRRQLTEQRMYGEGVVVLH